MTSMGGFRIHIRPDMFFDRSAIKSALDAMEYRALMRGSARIKDYAKNSIKRVGRARPPLKIQRLNQNLSLAQIARLGPLNIRNRNQAIRTIREIQARDPSDPGNPPHTHVPISLMVGLRRNIYNAYDVNTHSAVAGPSKKGESWWIPQLHEFGGPGGQRQRGWAFVGQWPVSSKGPIIKWIAEGKSPRDGGKWVPTNLRRGTAAYPPRPFMLPAMNKAIARGILAKEFRGRFHAARRGQ